MINMGTVRPSVVVAIFSTTRLGLSFCNSLIKAKTSAWREVAVYWLLSATVKGAFGGRADDGEDSLDWPAACGWSKASDQAAPVLRGAGFFPASAVKPIEITKKRRKKLIKTDFINFFFSMSKTAFLSCCDFWVYISRVRRLKPASI